MSLSALEAILERGKGGIWFLPAHMDPAAVRKAAKEAGFAFFHIATAPLTPGSMATILIPSSPVVS